VAEGTSIGDQEAERRALASMATTTNAIASSGDDRPEQCQHLQSATYAIHGACSLSGIGRPKDTTFSNGAERRWRARWNFYVAGVNVRRRGTTGILSRVPADPASCHYSRMYTLIKHLHMTLAILSLAGFMVRGVLHLRRSTLVRHRLSRIAPHVVDTALLLTGLWLAWIWRMHEYMQPWLMAKLIALLVYIGLGLVAFRFAPTTACKALAWCAALGVFGYMLAVANTKSVLPLSS
jgi:uncharacterized membrane protein SirB2